MAPRVQPIVAVLIEPAQGARKCLLVRLRGGPADGFGLLTGVVRAGESLEEAVQREVREATGLQVDHLVFEASQAWSHPGSLVVGFRARTRSGWARSPSGAREFRWFSRTEVRERLEGSDRLRHGPESESIEHSLLWEWVWGGT